MKPFSFSKYQATGNDFILIDDRDSNICLTSDGIEKICHRRFGIGADGIILLQKGDYSFFRMRIFNSDGSEAESCGNGLLCFFRFLKDLGLIQKRGTAQIMNGLVKGKFFSDQISLELPNPQKIEWKIPYTYDDKAWELHFLDTGVPHTVVFSENIQVIDVDKMGRVIREDSLFEEKGTNVNFVQILEKNTIKIRTFERGVEGETFSCGTGSAASALAAYYIHQVQKPVKVFSMGGSLFLDFDHKEDRIQNLKLLGYSFFVFSGIFEGVNT